MEKQRLARQAALVKQLECGCPDSTCADGKSCSHPMRRITTAKQLIDNKRIDSNNQVTSTTPNVLVGQRLYPRWVDRRNRDHLPDLTQTNNNNNSTTTTQQQQQQKNLIDGTSGSIHFQVIPTTSNTHISNISNQISTRSNTNTTTTSITINNLNSSSSNNSNSSTNNPTNNNSQLANQNNQLNRNMIINSNNNNQQLTAVVTHSNSNQINLTTGAINTRDNTILTNNDGHISMSTNHILNHHQQQQQHHHHQQQQQQQQHLIDNNVVNQRSNNLINGNRITVSNSTPIVTSAPPLVLSLSQVRKLILIV